VREGAVASIQVELTAREARFRFYTSTFTLAEVEEAYLAASSHPNVGLRHLVNALKTIGLKLRLPFQLAVPKLNEALAWNGEGFVRTLVSKPPMKTTLRIKSNPTGKSWVGGLIERADWNAKIQNALRRRCYTCPVPLIVDGRRLDSLQACWGHGWGPRTYPLALGFAEASIPALPISPGTFEKRPKTKGPEVEQDAAGAMARVSPRSMASVPFLVTYHLEEKERRPRESLIYWVEDGVVVETEPLLKARSTTTVGCFVNAEGLDVDPTSLDLPEGEERIRRKATVRRAVADELREIKVLDESLEELAESARTKGSLNRKVFLLAGFGAFWVSPVAAVLLAGAAWFSGRSPDASIQGRIRRYRKEIDELLALLET
jgi:hypothetical protein